MFLLTFPLMSLLAIVDEFKNSPHRFVWQCIDLMKTWLIKIVIHNLSSCENKAWKKFRPEQDSNPWPLRYHCSALPTELSSQLWADNVVISHVFSHVFTSFSAVQLYDHSFIQLAIYFTIYEYITNSQCDWFPVGLKAQLVEHCTGITKVKGLNLVQVLNFFQALISQLLKSCTTVLINHLFISFSAFQI